MCGRVQITIVSARTVHIHVAQGHVVENACTGHAIAKGGVAGGVATRAILGAGKGVVSGIRITGTGASGLIYERLYGSHYRRGDRSSAKTGPRVGRTGTGKSSVTGVGIACHVVVPPQAVRGKERNIGNVAHAITRIAKDGLPTGLGISCARSTDDVGNCRRSGSTATRAAAASVGSQMTTAHGAIAKPTRTIGRGIA